MNKQQDYTFETGTKDVVKGCVIGGTVISVVTPLLSWTNLTIEAKKKSLENHLIANPKSKTLPRVNIYPLLLNRRVFANTSTYVYSVAPNTALCVAANNFLARYTPNNGAGNTIAAFGAGFIAGLVSAPFEAIAQARDLNKNTTSKDIALQAIKVNGISVLMRGALMVCLKEGLWGYVYMAAPKNIGAFFESLRVDKSNADRLGAFGAGALFGCSSCILKQFQYQKQNNLTLPKPAPSYPTIAKQLWQRAPCASTTRKISLFFVGGVPRTIASATAAVLLNEGMKLFPNQ